MVDKILTLPNQQLDGEQPRYQPDDDEIALAIADDWKGSARYFYSDWHVYENGAWQRRDLHELKVGLRQFLRRYRGQGIRVTQRRINALAQMLEDDLYTPDRKLIEVMEVQRSYINLRNGLYNLETHQLEPHNPDLMFTHQLDFDYDPDADCPNFRRYIRKSLVHPDSGKPDGLLETLMLEALAYSMTARTDLKASFWLWGKPDSGKSTFIAFVRGLMGSLHVTIDLNQLSTNKFMLSAIVGKRVVTFTEAESNSVLPDGLYKAMVGGTDEIFADVKNKPGISFKPEAKFWWAMNEMPRISDRSGAAFNRLNIIPFNRTIPQEERIPNLDKILLSERAGVFNDLMANYKRLCRAGNFEFVPQSASFRQQFQMENDTEATFIQECTAIQHTSRVGSQELYNRYRNWSEENGFRPKNSNQVGKDWQRLGLEKRFIDGRYWWQGIKFQDS